jgi:small Trp-rich protein
VRYSVTQEAFVMVFVVIGVLLFGLWMGDVGPFGQLDWWWIALPFALAVLWWEFADRSGLTERRVMDKLEKRKIERREKAMESLGLKVAGKQRDRDVTLHTEAKARRVSADPTHDGRDAAPKVVAQSEVQRRRDARL